MTPDAHTNQELFVEVGDGHELYVHDWGDKDAKTTFIHLHGGPGDQCKDKYKTMYDPARQRVIFFDQRGGGRSLPHGSLEHNTTQDLIDDITKIADKLHIKQFVLRGGSWGSCLALAYGLQHPERVKAMALDGIFTGSQAENDWVLQGMSRTFFPDAWQTLLDKTPKAHHDDPTAYHIKRALGADQQAAKESAYIHMCLEASALDLDDRFVAPPIEEYDPAGYRIGIHYLNNCCFMPDRYILENAHKLTMPIYIVQGRYDMVCPPTFAYELHQKLPNSELVWSLSGHHMEHESWNLVRTIMLELAK